MAEVETNNRAERAARNQALFRAVNERLAEINDAFDALLPLGEWVCECANDDCLQPLQLTHGEYEAIRQDGTTFLVFPEEGHFFPEVERVTEHHERYWVVEKLGIAARRVQQTDPRD